MTNRWRWKNRAPSKDNTPRWRLRNNNDDSWNLEVNIFDEILGDLDDLKETASYARVDEPKRCQYHMMYSRSVEGLILKIKVNK